MRIFSLSQHLLVSIKKQVYIKLGESNLTTVCWNADSSILLSLYSHKYLACKYILPNIFGMYKFVAICSANLPQISGYKIFVRKVSILHIVLLLNPCQFCKKKITVASNRTMWYISMEFQFYRDDSIVFADSWLYLQFQECSFLLFLWWHCQSNQSKKAIFITLYP